MEVREKKCQVDIKSKKKNVLHRGSNKFQENCGTLFGEQCRNGVGGGSHVTVLQAQRGEPRLLPEQTVWSVQDSEQRPSKDKRPKAKTKFLHLGIQDTTNWNLVPVNTWCCKYSEPDPKDPRCTAEGASLEKDSLHFKLYCLTS